MTEWDASFVNSRSVGILQIVIAINDIIFSGLYISDPALPGLIENCLLFDFWMRIWFGG